MRKWWVLVSHTIAILGCQRPQTRVDLTWTSSPPAIKILYDHNRETLPLGIDNRSFDLVLNTDQFRINDLVIATQPGAVPLRVTGWETPKLPSLTTYYVKIWTYHPYQNLPRKYLKPGTLWIRYYPPL